MVESITIHSTVRFDKWNGPGSRIKNLEIPNNTRAGSKSLDRNFVSKIAGMGTMSLFDPDRNHSF